MKKSLKKSILLSCLSFVVIIIVLEIILRIVGVATFSHEIHDTDWMEQRYAPSPNSLGYRDREFSVEKSNSIKRIIIIGDSFTYGYGVLQEESFPKRLEVSSNGNLEVFNFGYPGWNIGNEVQGFYQALAFNPDMIILAFTFNDLEPYRSKFQQREDVLYNPFPYYGNSFLIKHSRIYRLLLFAYHNSQGTDNFLDTSKIRFNKRSYAWQEYVVSMRYMHYLAAKNNIEFTVLLFPMPVEGYPFRPYLLQVKEFLLTNNFQVIDLSDVYDQNELSEMVISSSDPHPSVYAHRTVAAELLNDLSLY